jgi:hypothetical protein
MGTQRLEAHLAARFAAHFPLRVAPSSLALAAEQERELLAHSPVILLVG